MTIRRLLPVLSVAAFAAALPLRADEGASAAALAAARTWAESLSAGDLASVYAALPESCRTALVGAARTLGENADGAVWGSAQSCASQITAAAAKKSGFLADLLARQGLPAATAEDGSSPTLVRLAARLGGVFRAATPEKLAAGDLASVLAAPALSLPGVTDAPAVADGGGALSAVLASLAARENADGSVTVGVPGAPLSKTVRMVQREGAWMPAPVADFFKDSGSWNKTLAGLAASDRKKSAITSALSMLGRCASNAGSAGTQQDFDAAVTNGAFPLLLLQGALQGGASADAADAAAGFLQNGGADLLQGVLKNLGK